MSAESNKKIGGEYGNIRANIDIGKLNAYLQQNVPVMKLPIDVKQFKVCCASNEAVQVYESRPVWPGTLYAAIAVDLS